MKMKLPEYYYDATFRPFYHELLTGYHSRDYPPNSQLVTSGEFMNHAYYVHSGIIRLYIISDTGAEKTEWFIGPGGLFPLYSPLERRYKGERDQLLVKTQTSAKLTRIPQKRVAKLIKQDPDFAEAMVRQYADFSAILLYDIINLAAQNNLTKICNYLYQYEKLLKPHGIILTQNEIATNIGIPLLTLTRGLKKLREEDIVTTSRKEITVTNWQKLIAHCSPELLS